MTRAGDDPAYSGVELFATQARRFKQANIFRGKG